MGALAEAKAATQGTYPEQFVAEEEIIDAAKNRLEGRTGVGMVLEEISQVVRGDTEDAQPSIPSLWVIGGESRADEQSRNKFRDEIIMDLTLQVDVTDKDAVSGYRRARRLVLQAGKELMRNAAGERDHRLGGLAYVNDVWFFRSTQAPPLARGIYTHATTYRVRFSAIR